MYKTHAVEVLPFEGKLLVLVSGVEDVMQLVKNYTVDLAAAIGSHHCSEWKVVLYAMEQVSSFSRLAGSPKAFFLLGNLIQWTKFKVQS